MNPLEIPTSRQRQIIFNKTGNNAPTNLQANPSSAKQVIGCFRCSLGFTRTPNLDEFFYIPSFISPTVELPPKNASRYTSVMCGLIRSLKITGGAKKTSCESKMVPVFQLNLQELNLRLSKGASIIPMSVLPTTPSFHNEVTQNHNLRVGYTEQVSGFSFSLFGQLGPVSVIVISTTIS